MSSKRIAIQYLAMSAIAAVLVASIAWLGGSEANDIVFFDRLMVAGAFVSSCIFGISIALRPGWIGILTRRDIHGIKNERLQGSSRKRRGHHPDCEQFEDHTIVGRSKTFCAGCLGLLLGSLIAIFLMVLFVIIPLDMPNFGLDFLIVLGMVFIALNYAEILVSKRNADLHVFSNMLLVIGFFLIVIAVFQLTRSYAFGIITVIISFLWLDTRVQLSTWRHSVICKNCGRTCKAY